MCSGCSRTARETQNIPLAVPEQSIAPLKEMLKRSLPASSHLADREVFPFLFSLPKKPILERAPLPRKALHRSFPTGSRRRGPSADPVKRLFAHCASLDPQIDTQERMPPTVNDHLEQPAGIQSSICHHQHLPVCGNAALQMREQAFPMRSPRAFLMPS
jgi:hypothetical protein